MTTNLIQFEFIGWCHDEKENHDKVWGVICISKPQTTWDEGKYVSFWGRRGKKLSTKIYEKREYEMSKFWEKKHNERYDRIHERRLDQVYPEFRDDLEKTAVWAMLSS